MLPELAAKRAASRPSGSRSRPGRRLWSRRIPRPAEPARLHIPAPRIPLFGERPMRPILRRLRRSNSAVIRPPQISGRVIPVVLIDVHRNITRAPEQLPHDQILGQPRPHPVVPIPILVAPLLRCRHISEPRRLRHGRRFGIVLPGILVGDRHPEVVLLRTVLTRRHILPFHVRRDIGLLRCHVGEVRLNDLDLLAIDGIDRRDGSDPGLPEPCPTSNKADRSAQSADPRRSRGQ